MIQSTFSMPSLFPVTCHTDFVDKGSTFVAIKGYADDGARYLYTAIIKGATTIVVHKNVEFDELLDNLIMTHNVIVQRVDDTRQALADLSAQAAHFPAKKMKIIGITGTKGKTTTSFLLEHCLRMAGYKTSLISSAGNKINNNIFPASLTTPQPDYLQQFLHLCVTHTVEYVVMEVAAQALTLHRIKDIEFDGIIFTNFSHEHLEFYSTLDDYYAAKCTIFEKIKKNAPIMCNANDEKYSDIKKKCEKKNIIGYSFTNDINVSFNCLSLFGHYNEYNMLAAATMARYLTVPDTIIQKAFATFPGVPGRLQRIHLKNGSCAFIDYAHNPSSFIAVLSTLRLLTDHLIVVFGAGGGKDTFKRPIMGEIACTYADLIILTSDNPRLEKPEDIIEDIQRGITQHNEHKVSVLIDRKTAIEHAYLCSTKSSIIAILGKGPDEYQIIGSTKYYFSEQEILKQLT